MWLRILPILTLLLSVVIDFLIKYFLFFKTPQKYTCKIFNRSSFGEFVLLIG